MAPVFLIGGGRDGDAVRAGHAGFVRAAAGGPIVALALEEGDATDTQRWIGALRHAGAADVCAVVVSPGRPPAASDLAGVTGVYVAGGWTPGYQETLVAAAGTGWLPRGLPYAGFSAGAAIAAASAIVGGFRREDDGRAVCVEEAGEDLEALTVRPGLGLVPFAVDVHATQWGTLTRLAHAVDAGLVDGGWAIDEGTALVAGDGPLRVEGLGSAYRIARDGERLSVTVARAVATASPSRSVGGGRRTARADPQAGAQEAR
jgi:cyanophycinase